VELLRLQRLVGNGAVAAAVRRGSPAGLAVQRACGCGGGSCSCEEGSGTEALAVQTDGAAGAAAGLDTAAAGPAGGTAAAPGLTTGADECGATRCGAPASCPPPFCCPFPLGTATFIKSQIELPFLAAIGAKVTTSVVPVWLTWFNGGASLADFSAKFGGDFTSDPTTAAVATNLAAALPGQLDPVRLQALATGAGAGPVSLLPALPPSHLAATSATLEADGDPNQMDFNTIGTAPGNLAGGIGKNEKACPVGARPSPVDDARQLLDVRATLTSNADGSVTVLPSFSFKVTDTVDLCPGNCGSDLGLINEQQATIPMSRLEASGVSGDVPFTVTFPSTVQPAFTVARPAPPVPTDVTLSASSLFDFGSDALRPDAEAALLAQLGDGPARADLSQPFVIEGHTDSKGSDGFNLGLSQRRAQRVADVLQRRFPNLVGHLTVTGLGKADPVAPNSLSDGSDNPAGRHLNRRVELHFSAPGP